MFYGTDTSDQRHVGSGSLGNIVLSPGSRVQVPWEVKTRYLYRGHEGWGDEKAADVVWDRNVTYHVCDRHGDDRSDYIQLYHFLKLLSLWTWTCTCRVGALHMTQLIL